MMVFSLAKTKEFLLHEMSKVKDLGSCIRYCIKYQKCISIRSAFNTFDDPDSGLKETGDNSLIIIKANYRDDGITYMHEQLERFKKNETGERERMDFTSVKLITYRPELDLEKYKKEYESLNRYRIRRNELRDKIFNTPELYNKAIELADKIKAENIEVLRSYGIDL